MVGDSGDGQQQQHQRRRSNSSSPRGHKDGAPPDRGGSGGGGDGADSASLTKGNPYAALLQATKIELLETHKNTAVAKR